MIVRPRPGFEPAMRIADSINPVLVILSIVGLFFEYTPYKAFFLPINKILDVIFVFDFVLRLICHRPVRYFLKGYGWVDFLASLPGIMLLFSYTPLFAIFKFVRIGRFFKIIRVLRFLRIFSFLKKMKSESPWIQDRIMKIGVTIVLVFVAGIFFLDSGLKSTLEDSRARSLREAYEGSGSNLSKLVESSPDILLYRQAGQILQPPGQAVLPDLASLWSLTLADELHWAMEVPVGSGLDAVLLSVEDLEASHDRLMLILLATLVALLLIVIFYLGAIFAKDMSGIHLIIDSVEADDYLLLTQEAQRISEGDLEVHSDENEMESILKVVARLVEAPPGGGMDSGLSGIPGMGDFGLGSGASGVAQDPVADEIAALRRRLEQIETKLEGSNKELVVQTIRSLSPVIVKYLRQTGREGK